MAGSNKSRWVWSFYWRCEERAGISEQVTTVCKVHLGILVCLYFCHFGKFIIL